MAETKDQAPKTPAEAVLVLIPTLNEAKHIERVLGELLDEDSYAMACQILVADGGSTDATRDIVGGVRTRYPRLEWRDNPGRIQAAAVNMALLPEFAEKSILIRCDAHSFYPRRFIANLVRALEAQPDASSIVVPMDSRPAEGCFQRGLAWISDTKLGSGGSPHRGGDYSGYIEHGHHAAFRMEVFRGLGGYDTSFPANEDAEYDRRVTNSGGRIWMESSIRIGYLPRSTARSLWRQYFRYGVGRARTCFKHRVKPALRQLIPVVHVVLLVASVLAAPFTVFGWLWPIAYGAIAIGAGIAMALAHRSLCGLTSTLALAVMHLSWGLGFLSAIPAGLRAERAS